MIGRFILRRVIIAFFQLLGVSLVVFFLIRLLPADPVANLVGLNASDDAYAQAERSLGLDKSIFEQLSVFLGFSEDPGLVDASLGISWMTNEPVFLEIGRFLPVTLELVTLSLLLSFLIAIPLGMASATKPGSIADKVALIWGMFAGAQPDYWWGLLFVFVFFYVLGVAPPPMGSIDPMMSRPSVITGFLTIDSLLLGRFDVFISVLFHLMLPVVTLVFVISGAITKMVRQNMVRALSSDYILYAQACGLSIKEVGRYARRAALTPAVTLVGIFYMILLSAAVTVELVFSLSGIGQYAIRSILTFDYPAIQGVVLTVALLSLFIYLILDIIHAYLDPRVQY